MKKAFLQLHTAVFLAGFTGVLGKLITMNEGLLVWYRLLFTSLILWVMMAFSKELQPLSTKKRLQIMGIGVISAIHWLFFYASIKYANVSVGLVCLSLVGFFSSILEPYFNKVKIDKTEVLFGILSVVGIFLIFHFDTQYKLGIILGIFSAFFSSLFGILLKFALKNTNVSTVLTWQMTGGLITISAILPFYLKIFPVTQFFPSLSDFLWLLVLAYVCSVVAFQLSLSALKKLSAFTVGLSYNLEPLYGILMAFALFKENKSLSNGFYAGLTVICLTLILHVLLLRKKHRKTASLG